MKIGLAGLIFHTGNKGCEALSYSFLDVLNDIAASKDQTWDIVIFRTFPVKEGLRRIYNLGAVKKKLGPQKDYTNLRISVCFYRKVLKRILFDRPNIRCDYVFDFTQGDSFTDIYGDERFEELTLLKQTFLSKNIPLVLGPQTIGPFNKKENRRFASRVIDHCEKVYVRDELSGDYTRKVSSAEPFVTTDVAFFLPWDQQEKSTTKRRIGLNVSGLLWDGGYTRDNQFGLTIDYREYISKILAALLADDNNEIHLISHATSERKNFPDNDWTPAVELHQKYPATILVDKFDTPMDAKSYISGMDLFIGSRMHATIAAISTGVPVIPVSYSRKFEGLFRTLDYPYVLSATKIDTEEAVHKTLDWCAHPEALAEAVRTSADIIDQNKQNFYDSVEDLLDKA